MDVHMPLLDGVAATKAIRSAGVQTPIVAITANTMESDIEEYKAAGMAHFVGKPINFDRLKNVIAELTE
jgi:CheY-like chemotaxis protein